MDQKYKKVLLTRGKLPDAMRGQAFVESIIVLPLFAFLMFGVLELAYLFHTKTTLNAATFDAARSGALHNAKKSAMNDAMAHTMAALYLRQSPSETKAATAYASALAQINLQRGKVEIISPTLSVFNKFKKNDYVMLEQASGSDKEVKKDVIPNDNLMWRNATPQNINSGSGSLSLNLQDANLLKIRTVWCHKLIVPVISKLIYSFSLLTPSADQLSCAAYGEAATKISNQNEYYVAVTSSAIVRMQSPIISTDLK